MLDDQLLFFFSAIGVFNALLLCVYLFFGVSEKKAAHYLLAALLLMFCLRVGVSCIYFFDKYLSANWIQLGLSANFLIGPIIWSYIQLTLSSRDKLTVLEKIHLWGNAGFIFTFGLFYSFQSHYQIWDNRIRYVIHLQLTIYLLLAMIQLFPILKKGVKNQANITAEEWRALFVYFITLLISIGFVVSLYTTYVLGPVFTSIVFYGLILAAIFKRKTIKYIFFTRSKYRNKKIDDPTAKKLITRLEKLMREEELYKNALLKLEVIAKKMKITDNHLSQLLNDNIGKSYTVYINEYRIKAAKKLLISHPDRTIESIGYEVGYNAKASFFTRFKKETGMTPSAFKKQFASHN